MDHGKQVSRMHELNGNVVAVIPARGGSKGIHRKNIRMLAGRPLIAWSIEMALCLDSIDRVIVTTEDEEIAEISRLWGAETPFIRPEKLADDMATSESVLQHALEWLDNNSDVRCDVVFYMQVDCPYRSREKLNLIIKTIQSNTEIDTVFAVRREYKHFWCINNGGIKRTDDREFGPRQIKQHLYKDDSATACASRSYVIRSGRRIGNNVRFVEHDVAGQFIDIHTEFDLDLANLLYEKLGIRPNQP